jgi:hypothetical protein
MLMGRAIWMTLQDTGAVSRQNDCKREPRFRAAAEIQAGRCVR